MIGYQITVKTLSPELLATMRNEMLKLLHQMDMKSSSPREKRALAYAISNLKTEIV